MEALQAHSFDAVIPYHEKDADILPYCLEGLRRHTTGLRNIYIISREGPDVDDIVWVSEASFPFTLDDVEKTIPAIRSGWYYQQLLKYYAAKVIPGLTTHYLIVDSDVVFLRHITFFRGDRILFDHGGVYHQPYFDHMKRLLPTELSAPSMEAGTTDCMMYRRDIMEDLMRRVETQHGCQLWEAMLKEIDPTNYETSGMSEQEVYFHFVLSQYPGTYEVRRLTKYLGFHLTQLRTTDVDFLSFHAWLR